MKESPEDSQRCWAERSRQPPPLHISLCEAEQHFRVSRWATFLMHVQFNIHGRGPGIPRGKVGQHGTDGHSAAQAADCPLLSQDDGIHKNFQCSH